MAKKFPTRKPNKPKACPRPYTLGKRKESSDEARRRCIVAAATLLEDSDTPTLKMETVAAQAGVTRQTIYNLFGSKTELIEAVFDDLARTGGMQSMAAAMQQSDPEARLSAMVTTLAQFWTATRTATRHIRAMAATDPDLRAAIQSRDQRRKMACQHVVRGFGSALAPTTDPFLHVDLVWTLTSFEFFDMLAGDIRTPLWLSETVLQLARAALGLKADPNKHA
ncbi:TetR family transcriptional regulator [Edaphobacter aggregans]|uniref:TetR family transcriptional regulator n=1 Tax=Edaphobacter aggregans TaxID=570835 RepID=A0A428MIH6_9BACT|nr:TetR/AcrR family transcriptional regulator [Edaphobacter aggregans]RSL16680.1 TetR family transcriptional regulator [Edaphobacter aggregans]